MKTKNKNTDISPVDRTNDNKRKQAIFKSPGQRTNDSISPICIKNKWKPRIRNENKG